MKQASLKSALVGGIAGAVMAAGTVALAGTGINGIFNLGVDNTVDAATTLRGTAAGEPQLRVRNQHGSDGAVGVFGVHSAAAGAGAGVQGDTSSTSAAANGVYGRVNAAGAAGDSNGVKGLNNGAGRGVYGQAKTGPGVYGNSTSGYGVWGIGSYGLVGGGSQGGVWATTDGAAASGVYAQTTAAGTGSGVHGIHTAGSGTGAGVFGETNSGQTGANGVLARANASNPDRDTAAVRAINKSANQFGMGVWGSIAGSGWGVLGEAGNGGIGVIGKLAGAGTGVQGQTGSGGTGVRGVGGKTGVYGQATDSGGYAFSANGNAGQSRTGGGWVKAMAYVDPAKPAGQQVIRCFNSQVAPPTPCAEATGVDVGVWNIDFHFDVSDRFFTATAAVNLSGNHPKVATAWPLGGSKVQVGIAYADAGELTNAPFYIVVL